MRTTNRLFLKGNVLVERLYWVIFAWDSSLPVCVIGSLADQYWELMSLFCWLWLGNLFVQAGAAEHKKNTLPGRQFL